MENAGMKILNADANNRECRKIKILNEALNDM